jgi:hypothetical protein
MGEFVVIGRGRKRQIKRVTVETKGGKKEGELSCKIKKADFRGSLLF